MRKNKKKYSEEDKLFSSAIFLLAEEEGEETLKNFENNKYQKSGEFLLKNAKKNAHNGTSPKVVAKAIYKAVKSKNPKPVINVGFDSIFVSILTKLLPQGLFDSLIRLLLKFRTRG